MPGGSRGDIESEEDVHYERVHQVLQHETRSTEEMGKAWNI